MATERKCQVCGGQVEGKASLCNECLPVFKQLYALFSETKELLARLEARYQERCKQEGIKYAFAVGKVFQAFSEDLASSTR